MTNTRTLIFLFVLLWALTLPVVGDSLPSFRGEHAAAATPADIRPSGSDKSAFEWTRDGLVSLAALLVAVKTILGQPAARVVTGKMGKEPEYVERDEFNELKGTVNRLAGEIHNVERRVEEKGEEILAAGEERAIKIHERINLLLRDVGEIRGELKHMGGRKA